MMVSGTYWPPYEPNLPRDWSERLASAGEVIVPDCLHESLDEARVLAPARKFDPAAYIHPTWSQRIEGHSYVVGSQPPCHHASGSDGSERAPVEPCARPAV